MSQRQGADTIYIVSEWGALRNRHTYARVVRSLVRLHKEQPSPKNIGYFCAAHLPC